VKRECIRDNAGRHDEGKVAGVEHAGFASGPCGNEPQRAEAAQGGQVEAIGGFLPSLRQAVHFIRISVLGA
jgi:hypothetical protein